MAACGRLLLADPNVIRQAEWTKRKSGRGHPFWDPGTVGGLIRLTVQG